MGMLNTQWTFPIMNVCTPQFLKIQTFLKTPHLSNTNILT